jgi:hypothetical protein
MAEYYFISQLPCLDALSENALPPISEERFLELCHRFLGKKALFEIENLTLLPSKNSKKSTSSLINAWNDGERNLRLALAAARMEKMKKNFEKENGSSSIQLAKVINTAMEINNPLEAEKFLNNYRLEFLETLRPMDNFSENFIYYYALKLKLLLHIRRFDAVVGEETYKNFYNSILSEERLVAAQ